MNKLICVTILLLSFSAFIGGWWLHLKISPEHFLCRVLVQYCRHNLVQKTAMSEVKQVFNKNEPGYKELLTGKNHHKMAPVISQLNVQQTNSTQLAPQANTENTHKLAYSDKSTDGLFFKVNHFTGDEDLANDPDNYFQDILSTNINLDARINAVESLMQLNEPEGLAIGLGDDEVSVRLKVIEGLENITTARSIQLLGQALIADINIDVRLRAVRALSAVSYDGNARHFLTMANKKDIHQQVRLAAAIALGLTTELAAEPATEPTTEY